MNTPTTEQIQALQQFAKSYGRTWKSKLRDAWETGIYSDTDQSDLLQQVRNTLGPAWLVRFSFNS